MADPSQEALDLVGAVVDMDWHDKQHPMCKAIGHHDFKHPMCVSCERFYAAALIDAALAKAKADAYDEGHSDNCDIEGCEGPRRNPYRAKVP